MKLFQMEVRRQKDGRVILAHFPSQEEAVSHVKAKFTGWEIRNLVEITQSAHFQIADLERE
ncbi:MAG TPA: hypothetical protein VHN19_03210 [Burkholderiales bacterium]|jgi:hypothetical protein|nr:hypothetical protein [Burkholderiales bacterium]